MARVANKDTFMYERVGIQPGDETEVRRQVMAGQAIPDHYRVGDDTEEGAIEEVDGPPTVGLGAAPQAYKHQLDDRGQLKEEHRGVGGLAAEQEADNSTARKARRESHRSTAARAAAGEEGVEEE